MKMNLYTSSSKPFSFLLKCIFYALPILILIAFVNFFGDAERLFENKLEKIVSNLNLQNYNVMNYQHLNDRIYQKNYILNLKSKPDIAIIGSSRTKLIRSDFLNSKKILVNNSVNGASIEDFVSLIQLYKNKTVMPKEIIMGLDINMLHDKINTEKWKILSQFYYQESFVKEHFSHKFRKYSEILSISYFQSSYKILLKNIMGQSKPMTTLNIYNDSETKLSDGAMTYSKKYRERTMNEIFVKINKQLSSKEFNSSDFIFSNKRLKDLLKIFTYLRSENVKLTVIILPVHPVIFDSNFKDKSIVDEFYLRMNYLSKRFSFRLFGNYNPNQYNLHNDDFYDGWHLKESGLLKFLNSHKIILPQ